VHVSVPAKLRVNERVNERVILRANAFGGASAMVLVMVFAAGVALYIAVHNTKLLGGGCLFGLQTR